MTAVLSSPRLQEMDGSQQKAERVERIISTNVKMRLAAKNISQVSLAAYLGVRATTVSMKLKGKSSWSVPDLVKTATFLGTTPETLMDATFIEEMDSVKGSRQLAVSTQPRYFASPDPYWCPGCDSNARHLL